MSGHDDLILSLIGRRSLRLFGIDPREEEKE